MNETLDIIDRLASQDFAFYMVHQAVMIFAFYILFWAVPQIPNWLRSK